jgi:hypothetical protein
MDSKENFRLSNEVQDKLQEKDFKGALELVNESLEAIETTTVDKKELDKVFGQLGHLLIDAAFYIFALKTGNNNPGDFDKFKLSSEFNQFLKLAESAFGKQRSMELLKKGSKFKKQESAAGLEIVNLISRAYSEYTNDLIQDHLSAGNYVEVFNIVDEQVAILEDGAAAGDLAKNEFTYEFESFARNTFFPVFNYILSKKVGTDQNTWDRKVLLEEHVELIQDLKDRLGEQRLIMLLGRATNTPQSGNPTAFAQEVERMMKWEVTKYVNRTNRAA